MKTMKGKLMKKLKSAKQIGYLNPDRILQVSALDGFVDNFPSKSTIVDIFAFKSRIKIQRNTKPQPEFEKPEIINVEEVKKDHGEIDEDEEISNYNEFDAKENICPSMSKDPECEKKRLSSCSEELKKVSNSEFEVSSFRGPDLNSGSLFDPKLLAAFEEAVKEYIRCRETAQLETASKNHKYPFFQPEDQTDPLLEFEDQINPLEEFEDKCPPGGSDAVIFYTTSLRGIRKTFEDCQNIRFLLESFGLIYFERDVSVHSEFRDELWRIMGERCLPPRLFIRGRYIGGAEQVLTLNEQGRLRPLFRDIPINFSEGPCNVCSGLRFMLCYNCNGSRKVFEHDDQEGGLWIKCLKCNENGLVVCPLC
ncbi:hypothetical protein BVRB_4g092980 [Beta vulgaris subsp. vulgaris]|uniref:uncharacterized protein At3g28850 n=1 Tax=Beta vulgaris subsp. vulgaris TaxID=3555 RepID=UPI0005402B0D|nr:uncharacterized protein At3g28850 [Beta vulgaris subsp. vulgaris]KMS98419.1 hypothetical protein BVRB_4g092980 [Beta vulgaris subsp. vulgaris]